MHIPVRVLRDFLAEGREAEIRHRPVKVERS
jgi:hypothetical protein